MDELGVLILTHGRPTQQVTLKTLRTSGYTGRVWLVVDDEDASLPEYQRLYPELVVVFSKAEVAAQIDQMDNFTDRRAVLYARNACFAIAKELGLTYFLQLDDDYRIFYHNFDSDLSYNQRPCRQLDQLFAIILDFYKGIPALTVALGQTGDLIGGEQSNAVNRLWLKRKAMNSFFCSVERPFQFLGRINEDVNTYVLEGLRGQLFLTLYNTVIQQRRTQGSKGGMTEMYLDSGTYVKSFYSVMAAPSCVKVTDIAGSVNSRLHHRIDWKHATPCILAEKWRKGDQTGGL